MWLQRVPGGAVEHLVYTTDGKILYTADTGGVYTAWDTRTKTGTRLLRISASMMRPAGICPAARSRFLVINGTPPVLWDVRAGEDWGRVPVMWATPLDLRPMPNNDSLLLYISESRRSLQSFDSLTKKPGRVHDGWTRTAPLASFDVRRTGAPPHFSTASGSPCFSTSPRRGKSIAGRSLPGPNGSAFPATARRW